MSTLLLNTPDSSSRDSSAISTPGFNPSNLMAAVSTLGNNNGSPNKINNYGQTTLTGAGGPQSPRASDTAIIVPRRIFVGGFPQVTTELDLRSYFDRFGTVRDVKIIRDHAATAKGKYSYGFVTFESDEEAKKLIAMGKAEGTRAFEFRGRYLNVNEAIKKPPFNKVMQLDATPPTGVVLRDVNGQLFTIQNGYAIIASPDSYAIAQPQPPTPTFPFVVQHPIYMAATAPPAPIKYQQNYVQQSPATAPLMHHPNSATVQQHMQKARFVFPPAQQTIQHQQSFNNSQYNNQLAPHLPPTPIASPVNPESPSKQMMSSFNGNNPAITNLTNPFPSILGSNNQQMPSSPYRWTTSTIAGPVTQLVYPGGYPTYVQQHDVNHYPSMQAIQQQQHHQQHQQQQHLQQTQPIGGGYNFYGDTGEYNSFSALDALHEVQTAAVDRRQSKNMYRMDGASMKE